MGKGSWIGIISMGNHGKSQVYNTWLISVGKNQKRPKSMGQPGAHLTGNFKFRSVILDIFILNTYSAKPLSLSMGKKGQPRTHFNGKYIGKKSILYFNGNYELNWR